MSHKKDRERAESGLIFRDGQLWQKDEWYALHPTRAMIAQKEAEKKAEIWASRRPDLVTATDEPYFCTKCNKRHIKGKLFEAHREFASTKEA